jgi:competence protein ComEC
LIKPLSSVLPFFDKTIDVVFISHADLDHFEGLNYILDNYKVRLMVLSDFNNNTESYQKLLKKIADKNIQIAIGKTDLKVNALDLKIKMIYPALSN